VKLDLEEVSLRASCKSGDLQAGPQQKELHRP
jgi:hypothetical protein